MLNEGQVLVSQMDAAPQVEIQVQQPGFMESVKNALQPEAIANKLGMDKNTLIDIGIYGAIGFVSGFLLKKYSEYFIALVLLIVAIIVLQQFDYMNVSFNIPKIHEMFGVQPTAVVSSGYGRVLFEWAKSNIPGVASLIVGFLIGVKVA